MKSIRPVRVLMAVALLALAACSGRKIDPEAALRDAQAHLQANDAAGAERILREVLPVAPQDMRLRITLGRAELALGNATGAEGTLRRAVDMGATRSDVAGYIAQAMLGQGDAYRALQWIGDLDQWPPERQLLLAAIKAQAELVQSESDTRGLIRTFADVFHRSAAAKAKGNEDLPWVETRLATLRKANPIVAAAYEHATCALDDKRTPDEPGVAPSPPVDQTRRVLKVGPQHELHRPSDAARIAHDNDVIEIEGGDYVGDVAAWTQNGLLLRGVNGRPHLDARGRAANEEGLWVFRGNDIVVENIEFSGARSRGRNGSGIRFFGRNLTIRDSVFHDNEDGVLTWNDPDSDVLIERSVFAHNGFGDGQSHNIYVGRVRSFTMRFSHSHDAKAGHTVKSRARVNAILYNRLTDEDDGNSSYLLDLAEGGLAYVVGNIFEKGTRAENVNAIMFAAEKQNTDQGGLWVINNNFYSRYPNATFVVNRSRAPMVVANNVLAGAPVVLLRGTGTSSGNFGQPQQVMVNPASYDFRLFAESALIDAGKDPGSAGDVSLWPQFEYVHPASGRKRQKVGALDLGAYEFCGW